MEIRNPYEHQVFDGQRTSGYFELYKLDDKRYDWLGSFEGDDAQSQAIRVEFDADINHHLYRSEDENESADNNFGYYLESEIEFNEIKLTKHYPGFNWKQEEDLVTLSVMRLIRENLASVEESIIQKAVENHDKN